MKWWSVLYVVMICVGCYLVLVYMFCIYIFSWNILNRLGGWLIVLGFLEKIGIIDRINRN